MGMPDKTNFAKKWSEVNDAPPGPGTASKIVSSRPALTRDSHEVQYNTKCVLNHYLGGLHYKVQCLPYLMLTLHAINYLVRSIWQYNYCTK